MKQLFQILKQRSMLLLLISIIVLAGFVRIIGNTHTPPSPYWEEVALGYDAYSILKTGADHQGNAWPVVAFPSFGDFKPSGYFYALVPSIFLFGLNIFAVRLPAVLAGTATTYFVWLWARDLSRAHPRSQNIALTSALIWALQPWAWWLGRIGFEVNLATFFIISGTYLFWKAIETLPLKKTFSLHKNFFLLGIPAAILLAASMYTYHGARLLAPLFTAFIALHHLWKLPKKKLFNTTLWAHWGTLLLTAALLVSPILIASQSPVVQQRIAETSIFSDITPVELSNQYREASGNTWWSRIIFHRYVFRAQDLFNNYAQHFSPAFLFTTGDNNPRHNTQLFGMLYPWEVITLVVGIIATWKFSKKQKDAFWLLAGLTILAPTAAMFTRTTPHALRAFPLAVWLAIISGWGVVSLQQWISSQIPMLSKNIRSHITTLAISLMIGASALLISFHAWYEYPYQYAQEWQYGYKEVISSLRQHQQPGEALFMSRQYGRPSMYVLFYEQVSPKISQQESQTAAKDQRELLKFQEWTFFDGQKHENGLHAAPPDLVPEAAVEIDSVRNLNGKIIWILYR